MAYSRFTNSDIYIYPHVSGHIECAACMLNIDDGSVFLKSTYIYDDLALLSHLELHRHKNHNVPDDLEFDILSDPNRYGTDQR